MDGGNKRSKPNPIASSFFSCNNKKCHNRFDGSTHHTQVDSNRINLKCIACNNSWVVCITYKRRFNSSRKLYLANKHFDEEHTLTAPANCIVCNADTTNANFSTFDASSNSIQNTNNIVQQCLSTTSLPTKSQQFFVHQSKSLSHAITHLVGQSFSQSTSSFNLPSIEESTFHLQLANIYPKFLLPYI